MATHANLHSCKKYMKLKLNWDSIFCKVAQLNKQCVNTSLANMT